MAIKSTFECIALSFSHNWTCPFCGSRNTATVHSALAQATFSTCAHCKSEYKIVLDLEGVQEEGEKVIKKLGSLILKDLNMAV